MPEADPRILFISSTRLGDAVLTTGYLDAVLRAVPGARATVVCGASPAPLFRNVPGLDEIIVLRKRSWHRHWLDLWRQMRRQRWTLLVDLRGTAISWLLRADRRFIRTRGHDLAVHVVDEIAALLEMEPQAPHIWLGDQALPAELQDRPFIVFGPTAAWPAKRWTQPRFAELAGRLLASGLVDPATSFVILGGPDERELTRDLVAALGARAVDLVGCTDALQAAAIIRKAKLFVGLDSGLSHIAAAVQAPTVTLFGPGHPTRYRPYGETVRVVTTGLTYDELTGADFDHRDTQPMLDRIGVDEVFDAARALLTM